MTVALLQDVIAYNAMMSACQRASQLQRVLQVFCDMAPG
jgi:pentatricopeptide repeat protein